MQDSHSIRVTIATEINTHAEQAMSKANEAMHHAMEAGKLLLEVKASLAHGQFGAWLEANVAVSPRQAQRYMAVAEGKPVPVRALSSKYDTVSHLTNEQGDGPELQRAKQWAKEAESAHQAAVVKLRQFEQTLGEDELATDELVAIVRGCEQIERDLFVRKEEAKRRFNKLSSDLKNEGEKPTTDWPMPTWMPTPGHWSVAVTEDGAAWWVVPSLEHPGFFHISKLHQDPEAKPDPNEPDWDGQSLFDGTKRPVRADVVEVFLQHFGMKEPVNAEWKSREKAGLSRPFGEPETPKKF